MEYLGSESITRGFRENVRIVLGLGDHEVEDVSITNEPKREAYFELCTALTAIRGETDDEAISAVNISSALDAAQVLQGVLPNVTTVVPAIFAIPGGGVGLQWNGTPNTIFTASVFGDGAVTYSCILSDGEHLTGTCDVNHLRRGFTESLREALE